MVKVVLEALEVIVTFPLTAPADLGAKATLKLVLWPDGSVTGVVIPLRVNPVPVIPA